MNTRMTMPAPMWTRRRFAAVTASAMLTAAVPPTAGVALGATVSELAAGPDENDRLDAIVHTFIIEKISSDLYTLNWSLANPASFGIDQANIESGWGLGGVGECEHIAASAETHLEELRGINYDALDRRHRDVYDTLWREYGIQLDLHAPRFAYYEQYFAGFQAVQSSIQLALESFEVRDEEDAEVLVTIIERMKPELESVCAYAREQAAHETLIGDPDDIIADCEFAISEPALSSLKEKLCKRVEAAVQGDSTTRELCDRVIAAVDNSFVPAFQTIIDTFTELRDTGGLYLRAVCDLPEGRDYYELLWRQMSGLDKPVEDAKAMFFDGIVAEIMSQAEESAPVGDEGMPDLPFESYEEMVAHITEACQGRFPSVDNIECNIVDGDPVLMEGAFGYYTVPPIDVETTNQIRINPQEASPHSMLTYSTVAHEGVPGHMYMYALHDKLFGAEFSAILDGLAYVEGYATYVERLSMGFLDKELVGSWGGVINRAAAIDRYTSALLDIVVNYDGLSFLDAYQYISRWVCDYVRDLALGFLGTSEREVESMLKEADKLLWQMSGVNFARVLPYAAGLLEFDRLRKHAEDELGDAFDELGFHEAILGTGAVCFTAVERNVEDYIERTRG